MSDFFKKIKESSISEFLRNGLSSFDMPNWVRTRGGWRPMVEYGKVSEEAMSVLFFATRLILEEDGKILFLLQTEKNGGRFALPGGNVENHEFAREALCREAYEEIGVKLTPDRLQLVHVLHRRKPERKENFVVFYFKAIKYKGEPESQERKKFKDIEWFYWEKLPENLSKHTRKILLRIQKGEIFSELPKNK